MKRILELDALRAVAAGIVLVFHLNPYAFAFGWTGVDLFFVLSGYLITSIILDHGDTPGFFRNFYMRRGLRIWPIYYLTLIFLVATNGLLRQPQPLAGLPYAFTYTQYLPLYFHRPNPPFHRAFDHSWTLALEEQFYLVWPLLLTFIKQRKHVIWLCLAVILLNYLASTGLSIYFVWALVVRPFSERILITRSSGFAIGGLLAAVLIDKAFVAHHIAKLRIGFGLTFLGAGLYLLLGVRDQGSTGFFGMPTPPDPGPTLLVVNLLYGGLVGLVVCYAGSPMLAPLRFRPFTYLGMISYGIYMYHPPVYFFLDGQKFDYDQTLPMNLLKMATTVAVAMFSWHFFEKPILKLKNRFEYSAAQLNQATSP